MRIAIVYDWIDKWGGVERLLLTLHEIFPDATFYTSYSDVENAAWAKNLKIRTSFMQLLPKFIRKSRILSLFLYPYAFESFNFKGYDLVISVTSSFAKSVITRPETQHLCILLTPTRYFWIDKESYLDGPVKKFFGSLFLPSLKRWDYIAAQRPDEILSISKTVQKRCQDFYDRESQVSYPPFDIDYWNRIKQKTRNKKQTNSKFQIPDSRFYLIVSRLEPYKKIDVAIEAFNQLPRENLIIVGRGSQRNKLMRLAKRNTQFYEDLTDEDLAHVYTNAKALIMPQEEDFGYTSLEAQFFGCPVIAYRKGGATETIIDGKTGIFFGRQSKESLVGAIKRCDKIKNYESRDFRRWSRHSFMASLKAKITQAI